jgi:two-component system, cell cycle sensor histidine kinase and response regulator CckA
VAHDFNNILTVILGNVDLVMQHSRLGNGTRDLLQQISTAAERAANLTRQLLTFSRRQPVHPNQLQLNAVVDGLSKMLRHLLGQDIELACDCQSDLPLVMADQGMIEQVLMNLAANAREAMPAGGQLCIRTATVVVDAIQARQWPDARAGQHVRLSVQDNGLGLDPEVLPRLFEPFFSTKGVGKGGLCLATVYGIVRQHQGWIVVESAPGCGTTFHVLLPVSESQTAPAGGVRAAPSFSPGNKSVLVVDDEDSVRSLACLCLKECGYRVFEAASGQEALQVWSRHQDQIALLLTDLVMPNGLDGFALAARLQGEKPSLKVIYSSGYSASVPDRVELREGINYLPKPYEPARLAAMVQ